MVARLKLKGIDGGSHKRWSMWLNSRLREEPYPGLDMCESGRRCIFRKRQENPQGGPTTGAAWLSSARVVRCRVKSHNERNPCFQLPASHVGDSGKTAGVKPEEGGDDVKSSWPLCPGLHTCYNGMHKANLKRTTMEITEIIPQLRSEAATRLREAGIASNRGSATPR